MCCGRSKFTRNKPKSRLIRKAAQQEIKKPEEEHVDNPPKESSITSNTQGGTFYNPDLNLETR